MLPNGYTYVDYLRLFNSTYLDTGIYPESNNKYEMLIGNIILYGMYVFGARNTNSNTSAGQLNLYINSDSKSYFGFNNARVSLGSNLFSISSLSNVAHISIDANELNIVRGNIDIVEATGSANTFVGTRTIYLGGLNNAGNYTSGACNLYGFKRYDTDGVLTHNLIPCVDQNRRFGVYNDVDGVFTRATIGSYAFNDYKKVTITKNIDEVDAFVLSTLNDKITEVMTRDSVVLHAENNNDYVFINWTVNDVVVSSEKDYEFTPTQDVIIQANFNKIVKNDFCVGYNAMAIKYGSPNYIYDRTLRDNYYAKIISASVSNSIIEKATTTIELENMPSTFALNEPLFIFSPKGDMVYCGIIKVIDGNTVTCEESLSIYDEEFLFVANSLTNKYSYLYSVAMLMARAKTDIGTTYLVDNVITNRNFTNINVVYNKDVYLNDNRTFFLDTPQIASTSVGNLEEYLMNVFNQYGIYVKSGFDVETVEADGVLFTRAFMTLKPYYIYQKEPILISDNLEIIKNVSITLEDTEYTWLVITNQAGTSLRAIYGMKNDGSIAVFNNSSTPSDFIAYNDYKIKVVNSGDSIKQIVAQNLTNAQFNHKITFDLYLDGSLFNFETLELGRLVNFYYQNKMYESVITGLNYEIKQGSDNIDYVTVTLGKVRNSLTSKLNLGKVK